jgi:hypothetical protein
VNAPLLAPTPGRVCPLDYRYEPAVFARPAEVEAEAFYVAGGVYGNLQALEAAEAMACAEAGARLALNGDMHWFDAEPEWFAAVEEVAGRHLAIRGNVETELARGIDPDTGCGCAYPASVDAGIVARSNAIIDRLARTADGIAGVRAPARRAADASRRARGEGAHRHRPRRRGIARRVALRSRLAR